MKKQVAFLLSMIALSAIWGCSADQNARIEVWLTDAPGNFQEVNVDIQDVQVHVDGGGWRSMDVNKGVYNLLDFTGGMSALIGELELPPGKISQVRLVLGENNSLMLDNQTIALVTPSAMQSGLKIQVHETLVEGIAYKIMLDFDVARSIVGTGKGKFILKPLIRGITEATSGAIKGSVEPLIANPVVYAIQEEDTIASTYTNDVGKFLLRGIPAGNYTVAFDPKDGYDSLLVEDVAVSVGLVTDMGMLTIKPTN